MQAASPEPFRPELQHQDGSATAQRKTLVARHGATPHQDFDKLAHRRHTLQLMLYPMRRNCPALRRQGLTAEQNGALPRRCRCALNQDATQLPHGCAMSRELRPRTERRGGKAVYRKGALHHCPQTSHLRTWTMRLCPETLAGCGLMARRLGFACASSSPGHGISAR
jgi:hypothetical protein